MGGAAGAELASASGLGVASVVVATGFFVEKKNSVCFFLVTRGRSHTGPDGFTHLDGCFLLLWCGGNEEADPGAGGNGKHKQHQLITTSCFSVGYFLNNSPLPDDAGAGGQLSLGVAGFLAAATAETFPCGGGDDGAVTGTPVGAAAPPTSCSLAVEVPQDVVVDLTGEPLLLQHPLDGFACCGRLQPLLLLLGLLGL